MEYGADKGPAGTIPEFGAIFMSNVVTKKECFKLKLFALPPSMAEFVNRVKAGMVLFLFEFERRELYGVYQATSDGAMNIAPHGFNYSGKHFPAQVPFTQIWCCNPLPEKAFRDAIRENYFSPKKFNFGLSEDQVRRLLYLFSSRKLKNKLPSFQLPQVVDKVDCEDGGQACNDTFPLRMGQYIDSTKHHGFKPAAFHEHEMNYLDRGSEDEFLIEAGGNGGKLYPLGQGGFLAKRRRIYKDDKLTRNDVTENERYSNEILHSFPYDSPEDFLDEVDRLDSARRLSRIERVLKENEVDKFHYPVPHPDYPMGSLDIRAIDDDQFMQRNKLLSENNIAHGSRPAYSGECYGNPVGRITKHQSERFLFGDDKVYSCRQSREVIDDHHRSVNRKSGNRDYLDCSGNHVSYFDRSASVLHKIKNANVGEAIPAHCRIHSEPVFVSSSMEGIPSDNSARPMNYVKRLVHDGRYPNMEGRVAVNTMDKILFSAAPTRDAGYYGSVEGHVVDDGRYRMNQRAGEKEDIHTLTSPIVSLEQKSISPFFDRLPEKVLSQLSEGHKFEPSNSRFKDATIPRVVPYVPEYPSFTHGYSSSTDNKSGLVQEDPHNQHHFHRHLYSSKIRSSPYSLGSEISTRAMDITSECADEALPSDTSGKQSSHPRYTSTCLNSTLPRHTTLDPVNYRDTIVPKPSNCNQRNIEREEGYSAYSSISSKSHFAFDANLATTSCLGKCAPQQERGTLIGNKHSQRERDTLIGNKHSQQERDTLIGSDIVNDIGKRVYDQVRGLTGTENKFSGISSNRNHKGHHVSSEAQHCNSNGNRRSVFTRLSSRQESWVGEERSDIKSDGSDCYMSASADEIMEMLQLGNSLNMKNYRLIGKPKHGESAVDGEQIQSHTEAIHSKKEKIDETHLAMEGSVDLPKETRVVNFKRRGGIKRSVVSARESTAGNGTSGVNKEVGLSSNDSTADHKTNGVNKVVESTATNTLKRRRLIRPVFGKVETTTGAIGSNKDSQLLILHKDDKQDCDIEKGNRSSATQMPGAALCSNANPHILVLHKEDTQNCKKAISSSEVKMPDAMCNDENSQLMVLHKNDELNWNCEKGTGSSEAELHNAVCSSENSRVVDLYKEDKQNCEKAISASEAEIPDAVWGNEESQLLGFHKEDKQNCEKAINSSDAEMPNAVCNNEDPQLLVHHKDDKCIEENSQLPVLHKDDKQDANKAISHIVFEVPHYNTSLCCLVASDPHQSLECNTEHQNPEVQNDIRANVLPSTSPELEEHETPTLDPQVSSSNLSKETTSQQ